MNVEQRVERLERQNRRFRLAFIGLVGLWAVAMVAAMIAEYAFITSRPIPDEIVASHSFVLVDREGKRRAELSLLGDDPALILWDGNREVRAMLSAFPNGPTLAFFDGNGEERIVLGAGNSLDNVYPESSIHVFDPDGKVIWQAP